MAPKVIVTLTTIPSRLGNTSYGEAGVFSCIKSLCNQSYDNYEIHFNIPFVYTLHNVEYIIPDWLVQLQEQYANLRVFRTDDEGPNTKILPTIRRIDDLDTIIIVVDDDMIYHADLVTEHVKNQSIYQNCALGYDGLDIVGGSKFMDIRDHFVSLVPEVCRVKMLQHYKSVSYKRSFFENDLFENFAGKTSSDDVLISAYMGSKDIHKLVLTYENDPTYTDIEEWQTVVGRSFPIISPISHDPLQGCNDPLHGYKFYVPPEFQEAQYLEK